MRHQKTSQKSKDNKQYHKASNKRQMTSKNPKTTKNVKRHQTAS
jgi:hypothetical protein